MDPRRKENKYFNYFTFDDLSAKVDMEFVIPFITSHNLTYFAAINQINKTSSIRCVREF